MGATVIATAGSDDKCAACVALGADHAINYRQQDFVAEARRLTGQRGVDVILDMVAGDYVERGVQCLAEDGRLVIIAVQGGVQSKIDAGLVLRKRLTVTGSTLRPRPLAFKAAIAAGSATVRAAAGTVPVSGASNPFVDIPLAGQDTFTPGAGQAPLMMIEARATLFQPGARQPRLSRGKAVAGCRAGLRWNAQERVRGADAGVHHNCQSSRFRAGSRVVVGNSRLQPEGFRAAFEIVAVVR